MVKRPFGQARAEADVVGYVAVGSGGAVPGQDRVKRVLLCGLPVSACGWAVLVGTLFVVAAIFVTALVGGVSGFHSHRFFSSSWAGSPGGTLAVRWRSTVDVDIASGRPRC